MSDDLIASIVIGILSGLCTTIVSSSRTLIKQQHTIKKDLDEAFLKIRNIEDQFYANDYDDDSEKNVAIMPDADFCEQSNCPYPKRNLFKDNQHA